MTSLPRVSGDSCGNPDGTISPLPSRTCTARARIREAALEHFANEGYDRATIRAIAQTAGVSPGLLRHHYGSKDALRMACDDYVFEMLHRVNAELLEDPATTARDPADSKRFGRYVARSLADGSPTVGPIFDEMVTMTEQWVEEPAVLRGVGHL